MQGDPLCNLFSVHQQPGDFLPDQVQKGFTIDEGSRIQTYNWSCGLIAEVNVSDCWTMIWSMEYFERIPNCNYVMVV